MNELDLPSEAFPYYVERDEMYIEVHHAGADHLVKKAQTQDELLEAKALDDLVFSGQVGISMEELSEIINHGEILLLRDRHGKLIGESQVITSPIPQHPHIDPDEAYNYGTAVLPGRQNQGVGQILFKAQEIVAVEAAKTRSTLTVRLENAQSMRARFKAGFQVVGYDPERYGALKVGGARLIMEKKLTEQVPISSTETLAREVSAGNVLLVNLGNVASAVGNVAPMIGIPVRIGDEVDYYAHELVKTFFNNSHYRGVGLLKPSDFGGADDKTSLLVLVHAFL